MLLIVAHHYVVNSGLTNADGPIYADALSPASLFLLLWGAWGKIGINCFVLITGYFMCKSQISTQKFAKLFLELMFYRIVINSIFWISGYAPFTIKAFLTAIIPFTTVAQNFTGTYLIFFLCIPFLNILIHGLNEKQHLRLICLSTFTYVFFGTVPTFSVTMNYVSWYMVLFFIASYIRLYPKELFKSTRFWGVMTGICIVVCMISVVAGTWLGEQIGYTLSYYFVTDSNTFLAVLTGVSSFIFFKNIKIKPSRFINTVSSTTFGILMIHANSDTMRKWLWQDVLNNVGMYNSPWIYVHAILSVIAVFAVCCLIDLIRIRFIEQPFFDLWDRHWEKIIVRFMAVENKICERLGIGDS